MLKGDLSSRSPADVLRELAGGEATGCLHVADPAGQTAKAYLRAGRVYAALVPGNRPHLGARLVSSGDLAPEALAEAMEAQRTELQGWRLGELLVHLGYVDQPVVEAFVDEQLRESMSALLPWRAGTWKFRVNERTREDVAPPVTVEDLLASLEARASTWAQIAQTVHGPDAVPVLSAAGTSDSELEVDADAWSLLSRVDGNRSLTDLARECGFTLFEAGRVVFTLVQAGLLELEDPALPEPDPEPSDLVPPDVASRLISALSGVSTQTDVTVADRSELARQLPPWVSDDAVDTAVSRVSETLAALLGPATAGDDLFNTPLHRPPIDLAPPEDPKKAERSRREAVRRERDAAELAAAQAELEAARAAEQVRRDELLPDGHVAQVVDLHVVREAARVEEERAAEQAQAEADNQARLDAERVEAERAETERVETEQRAQQEAAAAEQARREAERAEAERVEAERAEAERVEAERVEAEQRAHQEAAAAEQARREAERAEAERAQAERAEAERVEAERVEAERVEAERVEAERVEAERVEAEQRERQEAARFEAERLSAEAAAAEQARREAEQAEAEARRLAAEAEGRARREAEQAALEQAALEQAAAEQARADFAEAARLEQESAEQRRLDEQAQAAAVAAAAAEFAAFAAEQTQDGDATEDGSPPDRQAPAAAFAELSASASLDVVEPQPALATAAAPPPWEDAPVRSYTPHDTDTASLLRELSSLGLDDDPGPAQPPRPTRPPAPRAAPPVKKKKGLFGR